MRVNQPIYSSCFHCSYKQGNTCTCQAVCLHDKQVYSYSESTNSMGLTDEQLKIMTKDEANKILSYEDKVRWAELQNSTANLYFIKHENIEDVPAEGWWY